MRGRQIIGAHTFTGPEGRPLADGSESQRKPRVATLVSDIAYQNKAVILIYDLLCQAAADTMVTIAADPKRLGVRLSLPKNAIRMA